MGNEQQKQIKTHVIQYKWQGSKDIDLKAASNMYQQIDYLITEQGSLLINSKNQDQYFLKNIQNNLLTQKYTALNFNINIPFNKKLKSYVENKTVNKNHHSKAIWELINYREDNKKNQGIEIKEGNYFRIGKQIMKLKYLSNKKSGIVSQKEIDMNENQFYSVRNLDKLDSITNLPDQIKTNQNCRICLEPETEVNRFHNFCICYKNMPTHLNCLQMWLKKNAAVNENNGITFYNFLNSKCDICQQQFPSVYKNCRGEEKPLISPDLPENSQYCLLEIYKIQDPKIIKALMILDLSKNRDLKIGRGENSDIRFKHHSISRDHCIFKLKGNFKIFDHGSKFGTFIYLDKKELLKGQNLIVNIGNSIIELHPFRKKPCQCIKDKQYSDLQIDPYQNEYQFLKSKTKKQQRKSFSKNNSPKNIQCSLEEIKEETEALQESKPPKDIDLYQSIYNNYKEEEIADEKLNKSLFKSILDNNTFTNQNTRMASKNLDLQTKNEILSQQSLEENFNVSGKDLIVQIIIIYDSNSKKSKCLSLSPNKTSNFRIYLY